MTTEEKNTLVWQFRKIKTNTYLSLKKQIPAYIIYNCLVGNEEDSPLIEMQTSLFPCPDGKKIPMFQSGEEIYSRVQDGTIRDEDIFRLTEKGEDVLYILEKEHLSLSKTNENIKWAKYATFLALTSLIATIASSAISLYMSR